MKKKQKIQKSKKKQKIQKKLAEFRKFKKT